MFFSVDVYSAVVEEATCNCIPGVLLPGLSSSLLNCLHYHLDPLDDTVNITVLSRGQCDLEGYNRFDTPFCSDLNSSLIASGMICKTLLLLQVWLVG